nr:hypothetical protein [Tanacetum cinerariifolium]
MMSLEDINDHTKAMNATLILFAKAFQLTAPTNNNQRTSSNPCNCQIAQPGMNISQDRQIQNVRGNDGNQFRQYAGQVTQNQQGYNAWQNGGTQVAQNAGVQSRGNHNGLVVVPGIANQNGTGNIVAARAEGTGIRNQTRCYNCKGLGHIARNYTARPRRRDAAYLQTQLLIAQKEEAGFQLQAEEFDFMAAAGDLDEIEEVNANCILMANLQHSSTSGTQLDKAPIYDTDGSSKVQLNDNCYDNEIFNMFTQEEQYTDLLEPIPEPQLVPHIDNHVTYVAPSMVQSGGTVETSSAPNEETRAHQETVYCNLVDRVAQVNMVNCNMRATNAELKSKLARYKIQEQQKSTISSLMEEKKKLKHDFKTREDRFLDKEVDLEAKIKDLENILLKRDQTVQTMHMLNPKPNSFYHPDQKIALGYLNPSYLKKAQLKQQSLYNGNLLLEDHDPPAVYDLEETLELDRTKEKLKLCIIKKEKEYAILWNNWYTKCEECKYDKISHDKAYNDMQQKVERLQAQLRDLKGKSSDTPSASNILDPLNQKLETKIVELEFQVVNYEREISHLKTTYKNLFDSITSNRAHAKLYDLIYENAKLIARLFENTFESMNNTSGTSVTPQVDKPKLIVVTTYSKKLHASIPSHSVPQPREFNVMKHSNVIAPGMFKIDPSKTSRVDLVPNNQSRLVHTARTRRPQPKGNTRNARVPSASKSSEVKKNVTVEDHRTVRFGNEHIAAILGYGDLKLGNITITRVYFIKGLGHNLFLVGQFCDADLEVAFKRNTCFIRDLDGVNLLKGNRKSKRASHPPKPVPNLKQQLHLLYMDLCGPMRVASINGKRYVLVIVDDYYQYTWVYFLRTKDETPEVIKNFLKKISVYLQAPVIIVRTDNGTEFKNYALKEYFDSVSITHETSAAKTPQQNGVIERRNRTLVEAARTMLIFSRASLFLWAEAIATTKPDISYLHVFGALCYPKNDREDIGKLGAKGDIGFFIGYSANSVAYRVFNRRTKKTIETMNVTFNELSAMAFEQSSSRPGLQSLTSRQISSEIELTYAPSTKNRSSCSCNTESSSSNCIYQKIHTSLPTASAADDVPNAVFEGDLFVNTFATPSTESAVSSTQYVDPSNMHTFYQPYPHDYQWTKDHPLEQSVKEALIDPAWIEYMQQELHQFIRLDVWELALSPDSIKPLTLKCCSNGSYQDILGIRYTKGFTVYQMDVKTAFLHGSLKEDVYQASRAWYDELSTFLHQNGFFKGTIDSTLFTRRFDDDILVINIYVDDIIFGSVNPRYATLFSDLMKSRFEMSMVGEMTFFLGLQVNQSPSGIFINQSNYVNEILKKYGLNTCDIIGTPMDIKDKLDLDQIRTPVNAMKYRGMIGALMYLTSNRPDIVHATYVCARYQAQPTEKHLKEVKRIFRYLLGTVNMGLWYTKDSGFELTGFSDADYAGCKDTFKSTSGRA